jgi:hypothetical protein
VKLKLWRGLGVVHEGGVVVNIPVVFMARYVMVLRGATSLLGALEGVGPENLNFFGPKWISGPKKS